MNSVFITGGTGYIGSRLITELVRRKYRVTALVRKGSESKLPDGARPVIGDALDALTFEGRILPASIFIHLVGVAHPGPSKKQQFIEIDLKSIHESVRAAIGKNISHFIYLSVAESEIMRDFYEVRKEGEKLISEHFKCATFLRPFYVVGPGHYWPLLLTPLFKVLSLSKAGKEKANRLGLVRIGQMVNALAWVADNPPDGIRIMPVKDIRKFSNRL